MRMLLAAALTLVALPAVAQSSFPQTDIIKGAVDGYIRPSFDQFAEETGSLKQNLETLCATPSAQQLTATQNQFRSAVTAFGRVEFLRLGPLATGDRLEQLLFWPDNKGIALKQVQVALAGKDETATTPETLAKKSVAMQGLGALEYLLFGTGSEALATGDNYRCSFAASSATLIAGIAVTLDTEWQDAGPDGTVAHMLAPKPDAQDYRTLTEVLEKLAGTMINGTESIRDQRLTPVLGADNKPKPRSALFWRSGMTVPLLGSNFAGLKDFFVAAKFPEAMASANGKWISDSILFELDNGVAAARKVTDPIDVAVTKPEALQQLKYMLHVTGSLDTLAGENLPSALGLTPGFSLLDGD